MLLVSGAIIHGYDTCPWDGSWLRVASIDNSNSRARSRGVAGSSLILRKFRLFAQGSKKFSGSVEFTVKFALFA